MEQVEKEEGNRKGPDEAVEAMVDLIAQAREEEEQARERGDTDTVRGLGWIWRILFRSLISLREKRRQKRN